MSFAKKFVGLAAVLGTLVCVSTASAGFTPPSNITPYLPANNVTTVTKIATFANVDVYSCSMGGTISVPKGTPLAQVVVRAESNCAYQKFLNDTTAPGDRLNAGVMQAAVIWYTTNIYLPYYQPLLSAAAKGNLVRHR
jgi:hypothetical protein